MTDEERAEAQSRAHAAIADALAPLLSAKGIVGVSMTVLIAVDENHAFPSGFSLGIHAHAAEAAVAGAKAVALGLMETEAPVPFVVPMPVKQ